MTDLPAGPLPEYPPPRLPDRGGPPAVVHAAAVVTWVAATGTAGLTVLLAVAFLPLGAAVFKAFGPGAAGAAWSVAGVVGGVLALSAVADVVAVLVLRRRRWARWVLVAMSVVAAFGGVVSAYYVLPLLITLAAVTVVVLLFLPGAREWFRPRPTK